ncbi:mannose-1-phosphate guanylyltransferase [Tistrella bauzanensis]|uniref:Mannose-1-phosphate guanylyltransferase n=2 Tax=Tistrella bauzanensis TaxID=657419 RepID=A0ABQ1IDK5_9PROT|nr:mannose-1-phosphate guanylyltransferase [Tistrella bauzanensis]
MTTSDLSGHSGLSGSATADHSKPAAGRPGSGGMPASAMVLAAGLGTRMRPLSDDRPKPLVEVAGRPLIDWTLDRLVEVGVPRIVVNTHHHAARLSAHLAGLRAELATRSGGAIELLESHEDTLLETGGGVAKALPLLGDAPFFVSNSDQILLNGPTHACEVLARAFDPERMDALLLLVPMPYALGYGGTGDFVMDQLGQLRRRHEWEVAPYLYSGLQILSPALFTDLPDGPFSLNLLFNRAIERERLYGVVHDGVYMAVGTPQAVRLADRVVRGRHDLIG